MIAVNMEATFSSQRRKRRAALRKTPSLSQEEVNALPKGTEIQVIWSGGNGPCNYVIAHHHGTVYAALSNGLYLVGNLRGVGAYPKTQVWKR